MASKTTTIAWRAASARTRGLPTRWAQRPSGSLPRRPIISQCFSTSRYATEAASSGAAATVKAAPKRAGRGAKRAFYGTSLALTLLVGYFYGTDTRASVHRYATVPLIRLIYPDAEEAHHAGVDSLKVMYRYGLHPRERGNPDGDGALATEVCLFLSSYSHAGVDILIWMSV